MDWEKKHYPIGKMKQIFFLSILILSGCSVNENATNIEFKKLVYNLNNTADSILFVNWKNKNLTIDTLKEQDKLFDSNIRLYYSDSNYKVYGYCNGEFGGALMFIDKQDTDWCYYLRCTCAVMIDKMPDGYYITSSLAHISGLGKVQFFNSPKELDKVRIDSLKTAKYEIRKKLEKQGQIIIDTTGLMFDIFYPYKDNNYLIYSDINNTYLGEINHNKLIAIDTLLNKPTWSYSDTPNNKNNGSYHYSFARTIGYSDEKIITETISSGEIFVRNDTIVIAYKNNETSKHK